MKNQEIMELIRCFDASGLEVMKLSDGSFSLELSRSPYPAGSMGAVFAPVMGAAPAGFGAGVETAKEKRKEQTEKAGESEKSAAGASGITGGSEAASSGAEESVKDLTAPLVGTFYAASAPDQPAYVKAGDQVKKGDTLCLIEAMKMMNEIKAPCDCIIREITVENASLVEYGKTMMRYIPC